MNSYKEKYVVAVGPVCIDEYYTASGWVQEGNKCMVLPQGNTVGGMIPNAACVFAGYGVKTYFFDILNSGSQSKIMLDDLSGYGVDVSPVLFDDSLPDPKCIIVLTPEDRTILVVESLKPETEIKGERLELFRGASYIYSTVSEFGRFYEAVELAKDLKRHGARIVFDIESTTFDPAGEELFRQADILFFNEFGFEKYCAGRNANECFKKLFDFGVEIVTVTKGKNGSYTRTRTDEDSTPGREVKVVDPTGAGDTFNSSFVRCLLEGMDIHAASKFANAAASHSVTRMGPKGGVNSVEFIESLMRS